MSEAEAKPKKKKVSVDKRVPEPPKYSKAARRFYNENIRDSSQRLSKVLAAAGGLCFSILIALCVSTNLPMVDEAK